MPKMIIAIDGVVINEVELQKERTTLGRRPYNDVVIDNLAISGEHAVLHMPVLGGPVEIEDLQSTNGTYVNGTPIQRQVLRSGDVIEMGKYKIRFMQDEGQADAYEHTLVFKPGMAPPRNQSTRPAPLAGAMPSARRSRPHRCCHPRADRPRRRTRSGPDQGRDHPGQARRGGGLDHPAA